MNQEKKEQDNKSDPNDPSLQWEKKTKSKGIFELLQPIIGNFVLLIEEERKRTLEQVEKAKETLERMKNNR
jgi:hypothetical protein